MGLDRVLDIMPLTPETMPSGIVARVASFYSVGEHNVRPAIAGLTFKGLEPGEQLGVR